VTYFHFSGYFYNTAKGRRVKLHLVEKILPLHSTLPSYISKVHYSFLAQITAHVVSVISR
jgi:hypothetical protein